MPSRSMIWTPFAANAWPTPSAIPTASTSTAMRLSSACRHGPSSMTLSMLQWRRVDYVIAFHGTTAALLHDNPELLGEFKPLARVHRPQLYLSFSRHHPQARALLRDFDAGMRQIRQDGTYQRILADWQLADEQSAAHGSTLQERHNNKTESP